MLNQADQHILRSMDRPKGSTKFVALDFETANADIATICQIGVVTFEDGSIVESWQALVNPEDYFDPSNVFIHGITMDMVRDAPTFPQVFGELCTRLTHQIVFSHTTFDQAALRQVIRKYCLSEIPCTWFDSAQVVRRVWPEFSRRGFGLKHTARRLGIDFIHHDAEEDARTAGYIVVHAMAEMSAGLNELMEFVNKPRIVRFSARIIRQGNPDGPLAREVIVFTGRLSVIRAEAADIAAAAGCDVVTSLCSKTTILVTGRQSCQGSGSQKSKKHLQAEALIAQGHRLRILSEQEFFHLINGG